MKEMENLIFWRLIYEGFGDVSEEFLRNWFVVRTSISWRQIEKMKLEATMTSKKPWKDVTSNLKFVAKPTYATMFVWTVFALF